MKVGVPAEVHPGERRVAVTPDTSIRLEKLGFQVVVQSGAGDAADFADATYTRAGVRVVPDAATVWAEADVVLKVRPPSGDEIARLRPGQTLISLLWPRQDPGIVERLAATGATALALDAVPRISRAQKMDVLSSMANIAGYRAIVEAASAYGGMFAGQMTAAGTMPPAKVLVIGAGVAGLAAIAAARGLGAIVRAFDTRLAVREQVQSLGAEFLELDFAEEGEGAGGYAKVMSEEFIRAEMALFREQAREVDIIVTTALVPGKRAPVLITTDMVASMKPGSVVVDLAAEQGGNCELTQPDRIVEHEGVRILGYTDLPSRMARTASQLFGNNLAHLLEDMGGAAGWKVDFDDEAVRGALVCHAGEVTWPPPELQVPIPPPPRPTPTPPSVVTAPTAAARQRRGVSTAVAAALLAVLLVLLGRWAPPDFLRHLTVFVLACFIGWQVIWSVTPALHTPLMAVTNAISGIIVVGGMLQAGAGHLDVAALLGAVAILVASINIFGGFLVTQRMLQMFRK